MDYRNPDAPATEKQLNYLRSLAIKHEIGMDYDVFNKVLLSWIENGMATQKFIGDTIDEYAAMPLSRMSALPADGKKLKEEEVKAPYYRSPRKFPALPKVDIGFYSNTVEGETNLFCVVKTKDGQRSYAKALTLENSVWSWQYSPGSLGKLGSATKMREADVLTWMLNHGGRCPICCKIHSTGLPAKLDGKCKETFEATNS